MKNLFNNDKNNDNNNNNVNNNNNNIYPNSLAIGFLMDVV